MNISENITVVIHQLNTFFSIVITPDLRMLVAQKFQAPALLFNRALISPIILTVRPSNMDESELSQSFLSSLVFIRAASCNYVETHQSIFITQDKKGLAEGSFCTLSHKFGILTVPQFFL